MIVWWQALLLGVGAFVISFVVAVLTGKFIAAGRREGAER